MFAYNAPTLGECTVVGPFLPMLEFDWCDRDGLLLFRAKDDDEIVREFLALQHEEIEPDEDFHLFQRSFEGDWNDDDFERFEPAVPLRWVGTLIKRQWTGNKGPLSVISGLGNRFSCGNLVVNVYRQSHPSGNRWVVYPWRKGIYRWRNPGLVFTNK